MNTAKYNILTDTFETSFSLPNFKKFTRELLNGPNMLPESRKTGIWREYDNHINLYYMVANYKDADGNNVLVMAVELKKGSSVERARSMQRNFISKVLDSNNYEGAIVAFYTPDEPNWRLSLVRLDYTLTAKGVELDLTPAKRFSYLVGENEPNHTVQAQLLKIFEDDNINPTLDELEQAFSVEKVTKDFFNEYKEKYLDLKEYLEENEVFTKESNNLGLDVSKFAEQFAKKLMGQLAFLYFLQKKGWLGVRLLPENRKLSKSEFQEIYNNVEEKRKGVLKKVFKLNSDGYLRAAAEDIHAINDFEAELLSDCFLNTKHNMPWGSGNRQFIREIFNFTNDKTELNFFDDYLEPFFYDALNKKRKNHYFKRFNCKIPFLNGGLFEPIEGYHWNEINFKIPNTIFSNKNDKGREADGILDIFDRYNFTMNEDEPLEKEVAIDPEMLGKIFENLLDVSDRKSKGAFYTPREIVHYMCQESLINYLVNKVGVPYDDIKEFILYGEMIRDADNRSIATKAGGELAIKPTIYNNIVAIDEALKNVKVADPAVGSGAFPLGMLNEIVKARSNITEYIIRINKEGEFGKRYDEDFIRRRRSEYKMKWDTIKNSIFAVDIEPSAVDIAKLRLWLSVVVEQEIDSNNPEPHPLPNLDQNIMVGNSLIDEFEGIKLFDETLLYKDNKSNEDKTNSDLSMQMNMLLDQSDELLDDMFKLQDRYFGEDNEGRKKEIKIEIDKIRDELIIYKLQSEGNIEGLKRYEESLKNKTKPFFIWELEFAKIFKDNGGFDIVIGNPPYIGEENNKAIFRDISKTTFGGRYYIGKMDIWYFFTSKAIELLRKGGILSYIAPNNWMTTAGGSKMRSHIMDEMTINKFVTFNDYMIFENASQQTMIFVLEKSNDLKSFNTEYSELSEDISKSKYLNDFLIIKGIGIHYESNINRKDFKDGQTVQFLDHEIMAIIQKIKNAPTTYLKKDEVANGIHPHHGLINRKMLNIMPDAKIGDGIFIINRHEKEVMNLLESENELLKPYYDSKNISRYYFNEINDRWIIYTDSRFKDITLMKNYPNIKMHLDKYTKVITSDNRPYGLHRARKHSFFENEKIVSLRKCKFPTFSYIKDPCYVTAEYYVINTERIDLLYLLGILNSKVISFWLKYMGKLQGSIYQVDKAPLLSIPIVLTGGQYKDDIVNLVKRRLKCNNKDFKGIVDLESRINNKIYALYSLSQDNIDYLESKFN